MRRRQFIQALAIVPAAATTALANPQQNPVAPAPAPAAPQGRGGRGGQGAPAAAPQPDPLTYGVADDAGVPVQALLNAAQLATLRRLGALFYPGTAGAPGAEACRAAEFIDFHLSKSLPERRQVYQTGLDTLNAQARKQFNKAFAETDATQADALMEPMRRQWTYEPKDPLEKFLRLAHRELRTATQGSREFALASATPRTTRWLRPLD